MTNHELKLQLLKQPIGVAINSTSMLQSYGSGILTESFLRCSDTNEQVNHGVVLVGYGKTDPDHDKVQYGHCQEYWIIRNSWGAHWGEDGFFRLCMDNAGTESLALGTCLINSFAAWPITK